MIWSEPSVNSPNPSGRRYFRVAVGEVVCRQGEQVAILPAFPGVAEQVHKAGAQRPVVRSPAAGHIGRIRIAVWRGGSLEVKEVDDQRVKA